jgi:hypothetical protein
MSGELIAWLHGLVSSRYLMSPYPADLPMLSKETGPQSIRGGFQRATDFILKSTQ